MLVYGSFGMAFGPRNMPCPGIWAKYRQRELMWGCVWCQLIRKVLTYIGHSIGMGDIGTRREQLCDRQSGADPCPLVHPRDEASPRLNRGLILGLAGLVLHVTGTVKRRTSMPWLVSVFARSCFSGLKMPKDPYLLMAFWWCRNATSPNSRLRSGGSTRINYDSPILCSVGPAPAGGTTRANPSAPGGGRNVA